MSLNLNQLRREARSIRQLVTLGSLVTAVGGACAARLILGWDWPPVLSLRHSGHRHGGRPSSTRCSVVSASTASSRPCSRRRASSAMRSAPSLQSLLWRSCSARVAKGVASSLGGFFYRFGLGAAFGLGAGLLIAALVRSDRWIPHEHRNTFTLGLVLASYQLSEALMHESGIVTVTIAGFTLGNTSAAKELRSIREFKEELTVMFIGMLFVLLAADVRLSEVQALGWRGLLTVAALMFVVRPMNIAVGTWRAGFNWPRARVPLLDGSSRHRRGCRRLALRLRDESCRYRRRQVSASPRLSRHCRDRDATGPQRWPGRAPAASASARAERFRHF